MSKDQPEKNAGSFVDSPWFWGYIFATAALIALALAAPKYGDRQAQLERQFLARQEGGQTVRGSDGETIAPPQRDNLILSLTPLFLIIGSLLIVAWSRLWIGRLRSFRSRMTNRDPGTADHRSHPTDRPRTEDESNPDNESPLNADQRDAPTGP